MVIRIRNNSTEYTDIVHYGSRRPLLLDKLCAFMLAVAPILQHYKGLYENMGFTVLFFCFPILLMQFIVNFKNRVISVRCIAALLPLVCFELYTAIVHQVSISRVFYIIFIISIFFFIACGCVNMPLFMKYATNVVTLAMGLLIMQYISHYLFHKTINLRPFHLLVSQDVIWVRSAQNVITGRMYRPAAFFLEPSHLFLYSFPVLAVMLLSPGMNKWRRNRAIIISLAMLMSTSGFGIVATVCLWGLYFLFYHGGGVYRKKVLTKLLSPRTLIIAIALLLVLCIAYFTVPIFQRSINRIFLNTEGSTAIEGRTRLASNYIKRNISGSAMIWGTPGGTKDLDFNLSGFYATFIKYGIVGTVLSYCYYCQGLFKLKKHFFWINAIIIVISFFTAHTHGTFYMLYYLIFLMEGYACKNRFRDSSNIQRCEI